MPPKPKPKSGKATVAAAAPAAPAMGTPTAVAHGGSSGAAAAGTTAGDVEDTANSTASRATRVEWAKRPVLTERLVSYLVDNPGFRIKLFSDAVGDAKKDNRRRQTAKDSKAQHHLTLAEFIFADAEDREAFEANRKKFADSVGQRLARLRNDYKRYRKELGQTGSGLLQTAEAENQIEAIRIEWPWWDDLHAFWSELPNYAPVGVTASEPGIDHAAAAASLFKPLARSETFGEEEDAEMDADPMANEEEDDSPAAMDDDDSAGLGGASFDDLDDTSSARAQSHSRRTSSSGADWEDDVDENPFVRAPAAARASRAAKPTSTRRSDSAHRSESTSRRSAPASQASSRSASLQPQTAKAAKNKQTPLEVLRETRLADTKRLDTKRKFEHDENMEIAQVKRMRLQLEHERAMQDREHQAHQAQADREHQLQLKQLELQIALASRRPDLNLQGAFENFGGPDPGLGF